MKTVIHPTYFPSIAHFTAMVKPGVELVMEIEDNFQKQTYRNRLYIYGANGRQSLIVPIKHCGTNRQKYKDVKIENSFHWQKQHWKSLQTAYRTSPFFEFYEDDIAPFFKEKHDFLMDMNFKAMELIAECLQLELTFEKTTVFEKQLQVTEMRDLRFLVEAKKEKDFPFEHYTQVFENKHGFIKNLSILDLLFNEGPNTVDYLENQKLVF